MSRARTVCSLRFPVDSGGQSFSAALDSSRCVVCEERYAHTTHTYAPHTHIKPDTKTHRGSKAYDLSRPMVGTSDEGILERLVVRSRSITEAVRGFS